MGRKDKIKQTNKTVISAPGQTDRHTDEHFTIIKYTIKVNYESSSCLTQCTHISLIVYIGYLIN